MMKNIFTFYFLALFPCGLFAGDVTKGDASKNNKAALEDTKEQLTDFVVGNYQLIGKSFESDITYAGRAELSLTAQGLLIKRTINGKVVEGRGAIETIMADNIPILRLHFKSAATELEETCLVDSDLDNYARLTCHLYKPGIETEHPGMEAYFIDRAD